MYVRVMTRGGISQSLTMLPKWILRRLHRVRGCEDGRRRRGERRAEFRREDSSSSSSSRRGKGAGGGVVRRGRIMGLELLSEFRYLMAGWIHEG